MRHLEGSNRYIREFLSLKAAPDMLAMRLWPKSSPDKEITEAFGCFNAVRRHLRQTFRFDDASVKVVCVGDGTTPRAAVTFAFRTHWTAHSVDPRLRSLKHLGRRPLRLEMHQQRIESCKFEWIDPTIIVACHSHASLRAVIEALPNVVVLAVVAVPCCVPQECTSPPDIVYEDPSIMSPRRRVLVWRNVRGHEETQDAL